MANPFYDRKTPQFSERVLFERAEYDQAYKNKLKQLSKYSGYNKQIPSELLETIQAKPNIEVNKNDLYKGNNYYINPIAKDLDLMAETGYNKKKNIYMKQIPYIYKY